MVQWYVGGVGGGGVNEKERKRKRKKAILYGCVKLLTEDLPEGAE